MKKAISLLCALLIVSSFPFTAFAVDVAVDDVGFEYDFVHDGVLKPTKEEVQAEYIFSGFDPSDLEFLISDMVTSSSIVSVPVTEPCDESWRDKYPDTWMWEANRAIESADDLLGNYGIDFYSVSQVAWTNGYTGYYDTLAMVQDAYSKHGTDSGAEIMFAFTDLLLYENDYIYGRVEGIGLPSILITDYGADENAMTARHEGGHAYTLEHCYDSSCFMTFGAPLSTFNNLCSTHQSELRSNSGRY
ncbi:MAG: hypothetical protein LBR85_06645 [Oscillospiraceae bacterium]|nr:hypothetical protein [Oscillospiraceae bacterium]